MPQIQNEETVIGVGNLRAWVERAEPGAWCCYHRGGACVGDTAAEAMRLHDRGLVQLAQRRESHGSESEFSYLAVRRQPVRVAR